MTLRSSLLIPCLLAVCASAQPRQFTSSVNPFIGTDAHGHTFPGATLPFGMVQLSPDTRVEGWDACGGYHYSDSTMLGFSHTHLSGTGIPDYGDILFFPSALKPGTIRTHRFSHKHEHASPGFYRVTFDDERITAELTSTLRVGVHRYTFPSSAESNIVIDLHHGLGPDRVLDSWLTFVSDREVHGYRRSTGWAKDQHVYFVVQFSKPFHGYGNLSDSASMAGITIRGNDVRGFVQFRTTEGEQIMAKVGISSVDIAGARKNLETEAPNWNFSAYRNAAEQAWNRELGKIEVEGGTAAQQTTFYTALYHAMIAPNLASDVDGRYRGMDGKIRTVRGFDMYTVFSLWDTFRAEHPLLTILDPKRTVDFIRTMLAKYDESGVLPVWELASNETWTMIGYHSVPVILDAYAKGIRGFDAEHALTAMKHSAMMDHFGLKYYREHGYLSGDHDGESVSRTLEYAYDDWCISEMARLLGKKQDQREFAERGQYYKNVFDPSTNLMRGKRNGSWVTPFDPSSVNIDYTEANAWQYSFFVPQAIPELMALQGGKQQFRQKLDALFFGGSNMTGRQQSDITGMIGQYAQGNEPSHHVAYLYNYSDSPWKTQQVVRRILDSLYTAAPDGLCGNDDCGQMSAWYVLSAMGFYPVTPGRPEYAIGSPLFRAVRIHLPNGKTFTIEARNNSQTNPYVQDISLDGKALRMLSFSHADIVRGSTLSLTMGKQPNTDLQHYAPAPAYAHPTPITPVPFVIAHGKSFRDSMQFAIDDFVSDATIKYQLHPGDSRARLYQHPITISKNTSLEAFAEFPGLLRSRPIQAVFTKSNSIGTLKLYSHYAPQYSGGGDQALVDGVRGGNDFRLGAWQGYEGHDLDVVLDLGSVRNIDEVSLGCLQDINAWIFFPKYVDFSFSDDGERFGGVSTIANTVSPREEGSIVKDFTLPISARARYIRIRAITMGVCPPWHKGAGEKAWLFADEITVKLRK